MTSFKKKFIDQNSELFTVNEVIQGPAGLTVYYTRVSDGGNFSCLLDSFAQRFKEVEDNDNDTVKANGQSWNNSQRCCG